ncbi:hypothetical protein swp_2720 [Shewanella piezotolerans WP3]|uniref:Uncharacterized protein n=1 Tax=Shewanella piezotolerans (strain WP3 / JCM 13877) TaxID=225849 RepID=B8CMR0_SHEPW|nr:hypothetical protein [Shewanella piezotolerans]ACJ29451.1 hypothetical protein swp_2720 [Shewanella piezotolerans WP3]
MPFRKIQSQCSKGKSFNQFQQYRSLPKRLRKIAAVFWVSFLCEEKKAGSHYQLAKSIIGDDSIDKTHSEFRAIYRFLKRKSKGEICSRYHPLEHIEGYEQECTRLLYHPIWPLLASNQKRYLELTDIVAQLPPQITSCISKDNGLSLGAGWKSICNQTNLDALCGLFALAVWVNHECDDINTQKKLTVLSQLNESIFKMIFRLFTLFISEADFEPFAFKYLNYLCQLIGKSCSEFLMHEPSNIKLKISALELYCSFENKEAELMIPSGFLAKPNSYILFSGSGPTNINYLALYRLYQALTSLASSPKYKQLLPGVNNSSNAAYFLPLIQHSSLHLYLYFLRGKAFCLAHNIPIEQYEYAQVEFNKSCETYRNTI